MVQVSWWVVETPNIHLGNVTPSIVEASTRQEAGQKGNGVVEGGPFNTQQDAQKFLDGLKTTPGGSDIAPSGGIDLPHLPNPLSGIERAGKVLESAYKMITDAAMWRSLGWIILGVILIIAGIYLFLKKQDLIPDVVPIPV